MVSSPRGHQTDLTLMAWEAPDLLNRIFKTPNTGEGSTLGSFLGGYIAGSDKAKAKAADASAQPAAPTGADEGAQSGANYQGGAASSPAVASPSPGWFRDFAKSTLEGTQIAQNITAFEAAKTTDKVRQAQLAGDVLKNRQLQNELDFQTSDAAIMHQYQQDTGNDAAKVHAMGPPPGLSARGLANWMEYNSALQGTAVAQAQQTQDAAVNAGLAEFIKAGGDASTVTANGKVDRTALAKGLQAQGVTKYNQALGIKTAEDAEKVKLAEIAGGSRTAVATIAAGGREKVADINAQAKIDAENIRSTRTDKRIQAAADALALKTNNARATLAYTREAQAINSDISVGATAEAKLAKLRALNKKYGLPDTFLKGAEDDAPAADPAAPAADPLKLF